jgi:hypothetical protein
MIRDTREHLERGRRVARTRRARRAARAASFIHSSLVWCWTMNSISL